ncbi:hypothetical protein FA13DRAFT_1729908, partial [Coprinellus micaceus]
YGYQRRKGTQTSSVPSPPRTLVPNHCVVYLPLPSIWITSAAEEAQKQRRKPEKEPDENGRSLPRWWCLENSEHRRLSLSGGHSALGGLLDA